MRLTKQLARPLALHLALAAALCSPWPASAANDKPPEAGRPSAGRPFTLDDLAAIADVSAPKLSPDGSRVAYVVSRSDIERDAVISDVWLVDYAGAGPRQFTPADEKSESSPAFSPDGSQLAYLGEAGEDGLNQVFVQALEGGTARQLTDLPSGVLDFAWSPDGSRLVVSAFIGGPEKNAAGTAPPIVIDRFQFMEDGVGYLDTARRQLLLVDLASGKSTPLTRGERDHWLPAWSPDGKSIAYVSKDRGDTDRNLDTDVFVLAVDGDAEPRRISRFPGTDVDPYWMSPPAWSPDGKQLAWLQSGESQWIYYAPWQLTVADVATGHNRPLARIDRNFYLPKWSADGRSLYALLEENRATWLVRIDARSGAIEQLSDGPRFALDYDIAPGGRLVLLDSTDNRPFELRAVEPDGLRPLTRHNAWLDQVQLGQTREFSFEHDGQRIDGLLVLPPHAAADDRLPAIFRLHGGPVYQFSHEFMSDWQLYAAAGYAVVGINPRGSSGRGFDFARAIYADWGNVDVQDILAGADHLAALGAIDPGRLGVGGWSYGGMLTNYVIASDRRFKAAVSGAGTANMFGTYGHDQYAREYELELGTPWENPEAYRRVSYPFLEAPRITTPTLYQCGELDFNVPCLGSEQMYQALRSLGVPTRLVIYPGQYHGLAVPSYLRDRQQRNLDWYGKYLQKEPAQ
jgi:dipeptidyl aminopeptidase/acylaminoacyl peptidase